MMLPLSSQCLDAVRWFETVQNWDISIHYSANCFYILTLIHLFALHYSLYLRSFILTFAYLQGVTIRLVSRHVTHTEGSWLAYRLTESITFRDAIKL